ncbi:MAG: HAD-IIB family hydrolase, partial [Erysipelotrichaceae bacterium]
DDDILKEDLNKVCLAGNIEEVEHVNQLLRAEFKDEFWIGKTAAMWLEVCPKGNTKGNALETLANELNISSDEIMAFGDGENDIEMLKFAKYSYAMSNALPSVKAASSGTTLSNDEDGVYEILKNLIN